MTSSLDDMYREIILDHFRSPRGRKPLERPDITSGGHNPSCGDEIEMAIQVDDDILKDIHVNCKGCAISVASGSMLTEVVKGKSFDEVVRLAEIVKKMLKGEEEHIPDDIGEISRPCQVRPSGLGDPDRGVEKLPGRPPK
jgi:nitrogen fixation NifU-like protein